MIQEIKKKSTTKTPVGSKRSKTALKEKRKPAPRKTKNPPMDPELKESLKHPSNVAFFTISDKMIKVVFPDKPPKEIRGCMYQVKKRLRGRLFFDGHESFAINLAHIKSIHRFGKGSLVRFKGTDLTALVTYSFRKSFEERVWKVLKMKPSEI